MCMEFAIRSISTSKSAQSDAIKSKETNTKLESKLGSAEGAVSRKYESIAQRMEKMIRWADSKPLLVIFNAMGSQTITPLYRDISHIPDDIRGLLKTQMRMQLPDYYRNDPDSPRQARLQAILERLVCQNDDASIKERLADLYNNYALTPDNLMKMALIYMRMSARQPVILMGETGCGKTSLIRYLAATAGFTIAVFNFHAGISKSEIVDAVRAANNKAKRSTRDCWLFLDEINTCDHLGLINEIICKHSCEGERLSSRLVCIAACNPYRLKPFITGSHSRTGRYITRRQVLRIGLQSASLARNNARLCVGLCGNTRN